MPGEGDVLDPAARAGARPSSTSCKADYPDLSIHALNSTLANDEIQKLVNGGLDASLRLTIPLTFLILLIAFGAVVAAVIPLILAVTALLAAFGILGLYSQVVSPVSPYASQLVVLIGLAVAVDYSLFMLTRFRTERRHGRAKLAAIHVASEHRRTGGVLLRPRGHDLDRRAVPARRPAVPVDGDRDDLGRPHRGHRLADVPAGDAGDPRRRREPAPDPVPRPRPRTRAAACGPSSSARSCAGRSSPFVGSAGVLLVVLASPVLRLHMGQTDFTSFPDSLDGVQAVNLLNEKWPPGSTLDARRSSSPRPTSPRRRPRIAKLNDASSRSTA